MNVLGVLRRLRGLSQEEVGRAVGIRQKALSDYENGLRPTPEKLVKLAVFFRVSDREAEELLREIPSGVMEDLPHAVLEHVQARRAHWRHAQGAVN